MVPPRTPLDRSSRERLVAEVAILLLVSGLGVIFAQRLGPTTPAGNLAALLGVLGSLAFCLGVRWLRRDPWSSLGLGRATDRRRAFLRALAFTPLAWGATAMFLFGLVGPMTGELPDTSRFAELEGNLPGLLGTLLVVWIMAAITEEIVFRGFLMGRLAAIFGGGRRSWIAALLASSIVFGLLHLYQGPSGVLVTGFAGLVLGAVYLASGRDLRVAILTHGGIDTISLVLVYLGWKP